MSRKRHKSKSVRRSTSFFEWLEDRRLMSATLSPGTSKLVFNAVKANSSSQTLTITDTGSTALTISSISIVSDTTVTGETSGTGGAARFSFSGVSTPITIAAGSSASLTMTYSSTAVGLDAADLSIVSNATNATTTVPLRGIGTAGLGGSNQPSLMRILQAYSIPTLVGETNVNSSYYPEPPAANSQEVVLQRLMKAGSGPVTITPLASFTASGAQPYTFGTYTPGNTNSKSELFHTLSTDYQTVNVHPVGATSFDPGSAAFGLYFNSDSRTGYSEDQFNTFDTTDTRKVRIFPMENADGSVVPNSYLVTTTEWYNPSGYDFTNLVAVISNVTAAPSSPAAPNLGIIDPFALPGSTNVIFDRIQNQNTSLGDAMHDSDTLTLNNTGSTALTIASYALSAAWTLVNPPAFPLTIAAHSSAALSLKFVATSEPAVPYNETDNTIYPNNAGLYNGTLTLNSNDPNNPVTTVNLKGWWQKTSENEDEPSVQTIVNLMAGWGTNINSTPIPELTENNGKQLYGEEVDSAYWQEANPSQSVTVESLAAYHTEGATDSMYWYTKGSSSTSKLYSLATDDGQMMFPLTSSTATTAAIGTFSSTGIFGFKTDTVYSDDSKNTANVGGNHFVRFFPLRTSAGLLVPNTYAVVMDYYGVNFDFQDNVYILSNIRPATTPPAPTDLQAVASTSGVSLQWAGVSYGALAGYNVYRSTSATSGYTLLTSTPITAAAFVDTTAPAGSVVYYRVTAVDSSTKAESLGDMASAVTTGTAVADPLTSVDIGASLTGSTNVITRGTDYTVIAGGPGVGGTTTSDGFRFLYTSQTGNFDVKVQVQSITVAGNFSTAGLMARSTLDAGSDDVYMSASPANYRFKYRSSTNGATTIASTGSVSYPNVWVRLTRVGNVFTGYYSTNGTAWTQMSSVTIALPTTIDLGLAVASNNSTQTTTTQLRGYGPTTTTAPATPATPGNFTATGTTGGVQLSWSADSSTNLAGYNVYRSSSATGTFTLLTTTTVTSYLDSTAPAGATSFYKLTAIATSNGTESAAATASASPTATPVTPAMPANFTATGVQGGVQLSWTADSSSNLAGYNVYRSTSATGMFTALTSAPTTATTYLDSTAPVGVTSYYRLTAVATSNGAESTAAIANAAALAASTDPLTSVGIAESPVGSTTVVTPGTDYNVTAGGPGVSVNSDGFRFLYASQTGNFDVKVQVQSITVAGNFSTAGIMARGTLDAASPNVYMAASPVNYRFKYRTAASGTETIVTGSSAVSYPSVWVRLSRVGNVFTGYTSTDGVTWTQTSSVTVALPATVDLGLAVASNNSTQTTTAQLRSYGNTTTAPVTPATPTNFTATGQTGGVQLAWSADASTNLAGYNVYRSASATGTFTLLTATPITTTSYLDSTAPTGSVSYYKLTAVATSNGAESTAATASATATAATTSLTSIDIEASIAGSTTSVTPGSAYNVTAGGPGVGGTADGFRFLYTQVTGNFDVKVQVSSITVAGNFSTAGIMARSTLDASSPEVYMSASPANYRFKDRTTAGATAAIAQKENTNYSAGVWVRLARVGNVFNAYSSTNGTTWTLESSVTIAMGNTIYLGLGVASNDSADTTTAQMKNYGNT